MTPRRLRRIIRAKAAEIKKSKKPLSQRPVSIFLLAVASIITFSGFVTAQHVYIINDDGNTYLHYGFSTDIDQVLYASNTILRENDEVVFRDFDDQREIIIYRAENVTVVDGDYSYDVICTSETVSDLLGNLGIALEPNDTTSPKLRSRARGVVTVSRAYTEVIELSHPIPYETVYYTSNSLEPHTLRVDQAGLPGELTSYYMISYDGDGVELERSFICSEVTIEPVDEFIYTDNYELVTLRSSDNFGSEFIVEYNDDGGGIITTLSGGVYEFTKSDSFTGTAYSNEGRTWNTTYTGTTARVGAIAVDPSIIPLGTELFVATEDGEYVYGYCIAEDTGSAVKGKILDLYFDTFTECWQFGRRECTVYYLS